LAILLMPGILLGVGVPYVGPTVQISLQVANVGEHGQIVSALAQHDADWAKSVMISHIRRAFHSCRGDLDRADP